MNVKTLLKRHPEVPDQILRRHTMTTYHHVLVDGFKIFYREDGSKTDPAILLLHGFPTSSHMFRSLIPALADR